MTFLSQFKVPIRALLLQAFSIQGSFILISLFVVGISHAQQKEDIPDPIEGFNRGIFWFNDKLDIYLMEPVAIGYDYVVPDLVQRSVTNFFDNLRYPVELVSDLLQAKFEQAGNHTGRFLINSTVGGLGFFDVAKGWGLEPHKEDLGTAFGNWGMGPGFYLVLPILGPSNARDAVGLAGEAFLTPTIAITYSDIPQRTKNLIIYGSNGVQLINTRSGLISGVNAAKAASLDYYSFVKHAYQQTRVAIITDRSPEDELFDDEFEYDPSLLDD